MTNLLGNRIRELRKASGASLREFARKLGNVSAAHVSDIELGRRFPSDGLLSKIASVLDVPLAELKSCDSRPPVQDLKRIAESDPSFGFALRKLVSEKEKGNESTQVDSGWIPHLLSEISSLLHSMEAQRVAIANLEADKRRLEWLLSGSVYQWADGCWLIGRRVYKDFPGALTDRPTPDQCRAVIDEEMELLN